MKRPFFALLTLTLLLSASALRATEVEASSPVVNVIQPEYFGWPALGGAFYNATGIHVGNELFLYVQGGQYAVVGGPGPACAGDKILFFRAPWTASGLVSPFAFSSRISPCTATNYHYGVGGVFKSGSQYFLTADRANWPDANVFYEILLGSSPDGASWSWAPFVKSTGVSSILDVTLVSSTVSVFYCDPTCNAHTAWWGFFRTGPCANCADWVGRMKVDYSTAYPRGFRVWILSGGIYKQVNDTTGEFNFAPDNVWPETDAGYAPNALVPTASGGYELWATKSPAAGGCGCSFQGGSTLVYRTATDTTLGPLQGVYSAARCMPSASSVGRLFPFVITGPTGQRLLYTSNNDKNCSNLASNPYQGMYIVATQLQ